MTDSPTIRSPAGALIDPEHPDVATLYHNLGGLEHARGRYTRGEPWARRAVAVRERALGPTTQQWLPMWLPWRPSWMRKAMTPRRYPLARPGHL